MHEIRNVVRGPGIYELINFKWPRVYSLQVNKLLGSLFKALPPACNVKVLAFVTEILAVRYKKKKKILLRIINQ